MCYFCLFDSSISSCNVDFVPCVHSSLSSFSDFVKVIARDRKKVRSSSRSPVFRRRPSLSFFSMMFESLSKTEGKIVSVNVFAHGRLNLKQFRKYWFSNWMIEVLLDKKNFIRFISSSVISLRLKFSVRLYAIHQFAIIPLPLRSNSRWRFTLRLSAGLQLITVGLSMHFLGYFFKTCWNFNCWLGEVKIRAVLLLDATNHKVLFWKLFLFWKKQLLIDNIYVFGRDDILWLHTDFLFLSSSIRYFHSLEPEKSPVLIPVSGV